VVWCGVLQAVEVAKSAIADIQQPPEQEREPSSGEDEKKEPEGEDEERRKAALEKLEKASEDSILGQASFHHATVSGSRCQPMFSAMLVIAVDEGLIVMSVHAFLQGLKVFDSSVESITSGTWQALGSAWKTSSVFVQKYCFLSRVVLLDLNCAFEEKNFSSVNGTHMTYYLTYMCLF
jgi:hypothetical protein